MYFRYLVFAFLVYLLYRLVFHFIIPIFNTTRQVKKEFSNMQGRMQDFMNQQARQQNPTPKQEPKDEKKGDYIDFEEVK